MDFCPTAKNYLEKAASDPEIRLDGLQKMLIIDRLIHIITHCTAGHFRLGPRRERPSQLHWPRVVVKPQINGFGKSESPAFVMNRC